MSRVLAVALIALAVWLLAVGSAVAQPFSDVPGPDNPALASYTGGVITLRNLEDYASEIQKLDRCPRLIDGVVWRSHMCKELGKSILFTSQALELGQHLDPAFLRARNYYIQEWCSYAMLRDNVINQIDVDLARLQEYYDLHKDDWFVSATVSLRVIRTRDEAKANDAMARIRAGEDFEKVEADVTEMSLRQRGKLFGPFPTTEPQTMIPPPQELIDLALHVPEGETTGPFFLNNNYFLVKTVTKTPDRQLTFDEAIGYVDTQVRNKQGDLLIRKLFDRLKKELNVVTNDDAIGDPKTKPDDIVATIGQTVVPYSEYDILNGRVRGPALEASRLEPTLLQRFLVPTLLTEAAKQRGYLEDPQFQKALLFHDLRRIGMRMMNSLVDRMTPRITEAEIRRYYNTNKNRKDEHGHILGQFTLEDMRGEITELLTQQKRGEIEAQIQKEILSYGNFEMLPTPETTNLTAFEALIAAAPRIPSGYKVRMITSGIEGDTTEPTRMINCGRRRKWSVLCSSDAAPDQFQEIIPAIPAKMFDGSETFTSSPLYMPWAGLWRFDSDALARLGYEQGIGDYMAKYRQNVHINVRVEFAWAGSVPQDCWIVYEMRPLEGASEEEVLTLRFSGKYGSVSRKPLFECLPCEQMKRLMNDPAPPEVFLRSGADAGTSQTR